MIIVTNFKVYASGEISKRKLKESSFSKAPRGVQAINDSTSSKQATEMLHTMCCHL